MTEAGKPLPTTPQPSVPSSPLPQAQASIEDFQRLALRVGVITAAANHPNADRLIVLTVDLGEGQSRQLVAGIRSSYEAASLVGKHVVVVANLKPATLRGVESQGMVLAASDGTSVVLLSPEKPVPAGSPVK